MAIRRALQGARCTQITLARGKRACTSALKGAPVAVWNFDNWVGTLDGRVAVDGLCCSAAVAALQEVLRKGAEESKPDHGFISTKCQ